ncbi:MAG: undecaprenyl/decaprenyl-phosphate alpha-N-acetylglucosaminyl 1-phosphate transferase [Ruminococcaceae bacterium]|nr:undecaprenyl/decaprenyl-phosphate alpha-N-acetylglucosaminyl 1-phosphate transferase [Oscillospiraceae bacterium]
MGILSADQKIIYGFAAMLFAALVAFVLTPVVRVIAFKIGAIDVPKDERRMHKKPIPRLGGLAIFCAFFITTLTFCEYSPSMLVMWLGGLIIVLTGVLDDIYSIHPLVKLLAQVAVAFLAVSQGTVIEFINVFGHYVVFGYLSIPITVIWIVGLTNAINIIDGLDGLACGVSAICSISLLLVSLVAADPASALITAILAGCCIGFLPFNVNPAKIFMGDTGALFLGYVLSVISINGLFKFNAVVSFIIPISIFALPLFDTAFAFIRRIVHKKSPFSADKGHIHHRLIQMGFNQKQTVCILYSICGILGISAVMIAVGRFIAAAAIIVVGFGVFALNYVIIKHPGMRDLLGIELKEPESDENKKGKE